MRLLICSDLHIEFLSDGGVGLLNSLGTDNVDALVLAGDIGIAGKPSLAEFLKLASHRYTKVFFTEGNHEYYLSSVEETQHKLSTITSLPNVTWLRTGEVHEYMGHRFLGGTGWFPDQPSNWRYQKHLNDFNLIKEFKPWVYEENVKFRKFLQENLKKGDILITHHIPSLEGVHPMYRGSPINRFFLNNIEKEIIMGEPALVVFGHTHLPFQYKIGPTNVICNPKGYPVEGVPFNSALYIDIP